jgi:hypothetical protein
LHVPHAGQQQRGEKFPVCGLARANALPNFLHQSLARRVFDQPDEGLDVGLKSNGLRVELCLRRRDARKRREEVEAG